MDIYKEAGLVKLRFNTTKGLLSVEQLNDLTMTGVANIVKGLNKEMKKDSGDELSFLDENAVKVDPLIELRFNIAKDIYLDKKAAKEASKTAAAKKQRLQELYAIKLDRDKESDKAMSTKDLDAEIAALEA